MRWALLVLLVACGTTHIRTDDPRALIYVDGRLAGRGQAEMTRRGTPGSSTIDVVAPDGRRGHLSLSRSFTATTLVAGLLTDLIGLAVAWELPESVYVPLPPPEAGWGTMPSWD